MSENTGNEAQPIAATAEPTDPWWKTIGYGLVMWGATVGFYFYITAFEAGDTATARVWWPVALLYNAAGKWPVVGIGAVGGLILLGMGAREFRAQR